MNELDIFRFAGTDMRVIDRDGEPWFVAADVLAVLDLDRTAFRRLDDDERGVARIHTPGGDQDVTTVSESGLYALILGSRKPETKEFKRWVTREVIPSIRKTGSFSVALTEDQIVHQALTILIAKTETLEAMVAELAPAAAHAEVFRSAEGLCTIGDVANRLKVHAAIHFPHITIRHQDVFDHAGRLGIIIRGDSIRNNQPTAQAIEANWARPHEHSFDTNTRGRQTKVSTRLTPRGEARLFDGVLKYLGQHGTVVTTSTRITLRVVTS